MVDQNLRGGESVSGLKLDPDSMKELVIEATIDNLDEVMDFVNLELEQCKCPPDLLNEIDLAVEEIFVNIANYAYKPACGSAAIYISTGEEIVIRFEDTGKPYNPLEQAPPDLDKPLTERKIGGLGIFLVRQYMDNVAYKRADGKNILTITKKSVD